MNHNSKNDNAINNSIKDSKTLEPKNRKLRFKSFNFGGTKYKTTFTKKFENRKKWIKPNEKEIISFIPGTIEKIFIENGQAVNKGENMFIFEAMKMKNLIKLPYSGIIKELKVKEGDKIPKGSVMAVYEKIFD